MSTNLNPRQLVLRRDSATGLTQVGWEQDLPIGRFEHLDLICELTENTLPGFDSEFFDTYQSALQQAREANRLMLEQQIRHNMSKGWYRVPFELVHRQETMMADEFGSYASAATQLQYQLTQHRQRSWAVIQQETVLHVRARYPLKELDELRYQVWYHRQLQQLSDFGGTTLEGNLLIYESGLWFDAT